RMLPPTAPVPPTVLDAPTRRLGPWTPFARRTYLFLHLPFAVRLIWRCLNDPRVAGGTKLLFVGGIGLLLALLLVPEAAADLVVAVIPILDLSELVGIPFEGVVDWGFVVLAAGTLMQLFPANIVAQHIAELRGGQ